MKVIALSHIKNTPILIKYKKQLSCIILDYYREAHKDIYRGSLEKADNVVDAWVSYYYLYLLISDEDDVIGFLVMSTNNQYNMVDTLLIVDYMYIKPEFRSSKAVQWLFLTIGKVANDLGMDVLGTTLAGSSNNHNAELTGGETIATIRLMKRSNFRDKYIKYSKRLNVNIIPDRRQECI